jgi:hypothetical protein
MLGEGTYGNPPDDTLGFATGKDYSCRVSPQWERPAMVVQTDARWKRAVSASYAGTRIAQPSINRPMAAIQLPATRTAVRAQRTRTEAACPAKSDTERVFEKFTSVLKER